MNTIFVYTDGTYSSSPIEGKESLLVKNTIYYPIWDNINKYWFDRQLVNCTPHPINLINKEMIYFDQKQRKYFLKENTSLNDAINIIIPPSGVVLNAKSEVSDFHESFNIPIKAVKWVNVDENPFYSVDVIVSALYKSAANYKNNLLTVNDTVIESPTSFKIVGCLSLAI